MDEGESNSESKDIQLEKLTLTPNQLTQFLTDHVVIKSAKESQLEQENEELRLELSSLRIANAELTDQLSRVRSEKNLLQTKLNQVTEDRDNVMAVIERARAFTSKETTGQLEPISYVIKENGTVERKAIKVEAETD